MKQESDVIRQKDAMLQRQVSLLQEQLETVDGLFKRGAATVNQKLALEQSLATFESSHLDLRLASLKSRQEWLKARQSIADVGNQLRSRDLIELNQTEIRLSELSKHAAIPANAQQPADASADKRLGRFSKSWPARMARCKCFRSHRSPARNRWLCASLLLRRSNKNRIRRQNSARGRRGDRGPDRIWRGGIRSMCDDAHKVHCTLFPEEQ